MIYTIETILPPVARGLGLDSVLPRRLAVCVTVDQCLLSGSQFPRVQGVRVGLHGLQGPFPGTAPSPLTPPIPPASSFPSAEDRGAAGRGWAPDRKRSIPGIPGPAPGYEARRPAKPAPGRRLRSPPRRRLPALFPTSSDGAAPKAGARARPIHVTREPAARHTRPGMPRVGRSRGRGQGFQPRSGLRDPDGSWGRSAPRLRGRFQPT
ncbi:uncharacterized protein LOC141499467 [Macrotis lagotis]|uniref:uncharacterized protein LOC141499467 n=1 Tax=Macrotis lagotis TaxID=92651 RepID=UPI003D684BE0